MALMRHQVTIDDGGANEVTIDCLPFEWPRSAWELLVLRASTVTGWVSADTAAVTKLQAIYNGAKGSVLRGLEGLIVQYVTGTGSPGIIVSDWRGNVGSFCFVPNTGLQVREIAGSASEDDADGDAYHELELQLAPIG